MGGLRVKDQGSRIKDQSRLKIGRVDGLMLKGSTMVEAMVALVIISVVGLTIGVIMNNVWQQGKRPIEVQARLEAENCLSRHRAYLNSYESVAVIPKEGYSITLTRERTSRRNGSSKITAVAMDEQQNQLYRSFRVFRDEQK